MMEFKWVVFFLRAPRVKLLMMLWVHHRVLRHPLVFQRAIIFRRAMPFFAFLAFTDLLCPGSSFVSEFLAIFEIPEFSFTFVMYILLGDPAGEALFKDALRSCPRSTWCGALGVVIAIFTKSFTVAGFLLIPAAIVGATVVESFDIVSMAVNTFAIFNNFGFLRLLLCADTVGPFVAGAAFLQFIAIVFVLVAKCCGAIVGPTFFELLAILGNATAVCLLLSVSPSSSAFSLSSSRTSLSTPRSLTTSTSSPCEARAAGPLTPSSPPRASTSLPSPSGAARAFLPCSLPPSRVLTPLSSSPVPRLGAPAADPSSPSSFPVHVAAFGVIGGARSFESSLSLPRRQCFHGERGPARSVQHGLNTSTHDDLW